MLKDLHKGEKKEEHHWTWQEKFREIYHQLSFDPAVHQCYCWVQTDGSQGYMVCHGFFQVVCQAYT